MLGGFAGANEDHWNVPSVTFFENCIILDIHFSQRRPEFAQQIRYRFLGFFSKMAARPRIESDFARARGGQTRVLRMIFHGFGWEYFWKGPA